MAVHLSRRRSPGGTSLLAACLSGACLSATCLSATCLSASPALAADFVPAPIHQDMYAPPTPVDAPAWPPPIPRYRLTATNILGMSYNPIGFEDQLRLGAQIRLYRSDSVAFRENFVHVGINPRINPAGARLGPAIEIQPATMFNLKANLEWVDYFGSVGLIQSFASPLAPFDITIRDRNREAGKNYGTTGLRASVTPFVQFKVGPIAVRNRFTFEYFSIDLRPGDTVFYEPALDTLIAGKGFFLSDDLDVIVVHDMPAGGFWSHGRLAVGARYTAFKPLFEAQHFQAGDDPTREHDEVHRVGPLVALTLFDDGYPKFDEPTIVAMAQWYAAHPNRLGKDNPAGVPYLVLAFIFQSDLWNSN